MATTREVPNMFIEKTFTTEFSGRTLTIETGKLAQLANGSALVKFGDTVVLSTATASTKIREGIDYLLREMK